MLSYSVAHPRLTALLAGLVLPLAYPPINMLPVFYASFVLMFYLAWQLRGSLRQLACIGWLFGCGQFATGLYWIGESFLVSGGVYVWLMPFALLLLVAALALYGALAFIVWGALWGRAEHYLLAHQRTLPPLTSFIALLALAGLWSLADYGRGVLLTGFPWNLAGMAWGGWLPLAQMASLFGLYGMGLLALVSAVFFTQFSTQFSTQFFAQTRKMFAVAGCVLIGVVAVSGQGLLWAGKPSEAQNTPPHAIDSGRAINPMILVIQPNIKQSEKWQPEMRQAHIDRVFAVTQQALHQHPDSDIILWPETALPVLIDEDDGFATRLATRLPPDKWLILGAVRRTITAGQTTYFNSLMLWHNRGDKGDLVAQMDKHHLVPFGEYLPLQNYLEAMGLRPLTQARGRFGAGARHSRLSLSKSAASILPLICYEAIFPYRTAGQPRPDWLVNLTNDAWFGNTLGPAQHLAHARLRAIEQGVPLMRSANTGISAGFDGQGRLLAALPLNKAGAFAVRLPPALPPTLYAIWGNGLYFALLAILYLGIGIWGIRVWRGKK